MNEFKKRDNGCQISMDHKPNNAKIDAWTSIDETLLPLHEEESDSNFNIDEALTLPQPEPATIQITLNPFLNPFSEYMIFDDPLAHLEMTEQDELTACAEWIMKHQAFF
ncbi:hypothetical protein HNY73_013876 [Argiope bruennichi]|uniref:Uncharacterized protein n=1 Tax=Argiope bruennichi TaxID=94029 RepID=A0A8T0EM59_ARGBR|nr:hypothetical protein HNY73_013876 [Argiope bruennichi]